MIPLTITSRQWVVLPHSYQIDVTEEYADALAAGYRLDEDGYAHRIEQRRDERGVFGKDRGRC